MKRGEKNDGEKNGSFLLQMDETGFGAQFVCAVCCNTGSGAGFGGVGAGAGNLRRFDQKSLTTGVMVDKSMRKACCEVVFFRLDVPEMKRRETWRRTKM